MCVVLFIVSFYYPSDVCRVCRGIACFMSDIGHSHLFSYCFVSLARDLPSFFVFSEKQLFVSMLLAIVFWFSILYTQLRIQSVLVGSSDTALSGKGDGVQPHYCQVEAEVQVLHLRGTTPLSCRVQMGCSPLILQGQELSEELERMKVLGPYLAFSATTPVSVLRCLIPVSASMEVKAPTWPLLLLRGEGPRLFLWCLA